MLQGGKKKKTEKYNNQMLFQKYESLHILPNQGWMKKDVIVHPTRNKNYDFLWNFKIHFT